MVARFQKTHPTYDWADAEFGAAFGVFIFLTVGFQLNYLFLWVTTVPNLKRSTD